MHLEDADVVVVVGCRPSRRQHLDRPGATRTNGDRLAGARVKTPSGDDALVRARAVVGRTASVRQRCFRSST
jgi:hypothetical protein